MKLMLIIDTDNYTRYCPLCNKFNDCVITSDDCHGDIHDRPPYCPLNNIEYNSSVKIKED